MFKQKYEKFLHMVKNYDLISKDTGKIVIATSGGKDANTMTALLLEYKKNERPDLELELVNATIPVWKYMPEKYFDTVNDEEKKQILIKEKECIDRHKQYWKAKGIDSVDMSSLPGIDDKTIFDSSNPCVYCFIATKKALYKYLENHDDKKEVRLAYGLTKWDIIYVMLSQIARSGGKRWDETKKESPDKYLINVQHIASFSPYPKIDIGIPNKTIYCIQPIANFSDMETREVARSLELPTIPDICVDLWGTKFQSEKRHFDKFLLGTATEESNLLNKTIDPLFPDYEKFLEMFKNSGVLPPVEELNGILYRTYFDEVMAACVDDEDNK